MKTVVRAVMCLIRLAGFGMAGTAAAQYAPPAPRLGVLSGLLDSSERTFVPAMGIAGGSAEAALDGLLRWAADPIRGPALTLGAFGRRLPGSSWGGAGAGLAWRFTARAAQFWIAVDGTAGAGVGPRAAFIARAGGRFSQVSLELRSAWWGGDDALSDTARGRPPWAATPRYTEGELTLRQRLGPVLVEGQGGLRFGDVPSSRDWGWLSAGLAITRSTELFAAGGSRPYLADRAGRPGGFLQVGVRFRSQGASAGEPPSPSPPPAAAFDVARESEETWLATIQAPAARTVELRGDITGWRPVALAPVPGASGAWRVRLRAPPGVYYVTVRIDRGPWIAPPGLPIVPDGFDGVAGLLQLPEGDLTR